MDLLLSPFAGYDRTRIVLMTLVPALTAHTVVELARQVQRSRGVRLGLWLGCGSVAVAMGVSCTMELTAGPLAGVVAKAAPDHLLQFVCAFAGCASALFALSRPHLQTGWAIASSLALAFGFTAAGDITALSGRQTNLLEYGISALSFLVAAAASYLYLKIGALAKLQHSSWRLGALLSSLAMGVLMAGSLIFTFQSHRTFSGSHADDFLAAGLPLTAFCLGTISVLVIALAVTTITRQTHLLSTELQSSLDQQRIRDALVDQRVTRLQNDALLLEMQERQSAEGKLLFAALHDSLTGLENRSSVSLKLANLLPATQRQHTRPWVLLLNLDGFKGVNDLLGRPAGDLVLQEIAKRLGLFVEEGDVLARVGGDDFLVLMKHIPVPEQAMRRAHQVLSSIEEQIAAAGVIVNMSASLGLCEIGNGQHSAEDIFRDADTAMQVAKREGGSRCKLFASSMRDDLMEAQRRKMELKKAVEQEEFVLYYQPFVDMRDRSIYGVEALIRWNHPKRGLISPGHFIPLAEETGQILRIGLWTLRQACRDFATLQANSCQDLLVSVNVSPRQLLETPFLKILQEVLEETSMPPVQLQLEITESIFIKDGASIGSLLHDVRSLGVKVAFDDFGTGYSSLSYLTRYPIDTLKVDQSFVNGMHQSEGGANLILFIVALAHEFRMSVTAEGVEAVEQEAGLLKEGCMHGQGYLYSRPVPLAAMIELLKTGLPQRTASAAAPVTSMLQLVNQPSLTVPRTFQSPKSR